MHRRHGAVGFPPHMAFCVLIADDIFVLGRTAGMLACYRHERAMRAQLRFLALQRLLVKRCFSQIVIGRFGCREADFLDAAGRISFAELFHFLTVEKIGWVKARPPKAFRPLMVR